MNNFALTLRDGVPSPCPALTTLDTVEQKGAFCTYLIDSTLEAGHLSRVDIDINLFRNFIHSANQLSRSARLALAVSLMGDVLMIEQERVQRSTYMRHVLTPTIEQSKNIGP